MTGVWCRSSVSGAEVTLTPKGVGRASVTVTASDGKLIATQTISVSVLNSLNKITGPWLWIIAPTEVGRGGANSIDVDSLHAASGGAVTEASVAANGAKAGGMLLVIMCGRLARLLGLDVTTSMTLSIESVW